MYLSIALRSLNVLCFKEMTSESRFYIDFTQSRFNIDFNS